MYSENEDALNKFTTGVFGEYGYIHLLIKSGRTKEVDPELLEKSKLIVPDESMDDGMYFKDIVIYKPMTIDDEMENTKVNYFGTVESLEEVKERIHLIASRGCSGLDTVYTAKYDHGILSIANKLRKDIGNEIDDKFVEYCDVCYKTVEEASAGITKAYDDYQQEYYEQLPLNAARFEGVSKRKLKLPF